MTKTPWQVTVLTLFPDMFPGPVGQSLAGKALANGVWRLNVMDIRTVTTDKHRSVDDTPYGGGAGMVMRPDIAAAAIDAAEAAYGKAKRRIYLSPRGRKFDQALARELSAAASVLLFCGRYEGLDERVIEARELEEVSVGDFVLSGGELAAMALIDASCRLLDGVVGNSETVDEESFSNGLLEYPHYTRPPEWEGRSVPEVLVSGHHEKVKAWRLAEAERLTRQRRPDLWNHYLSGKQSTMKERVS